MTTTSTTRIPLSLVVAVAVHAPLLVFRLFMTDGWMRAAEYRLVVAGIAVGSLMLLASGMTELAQRLPAREAVGARLASSMFAALVVLALVGNIVDAVGAEHLEKVRIIWKVEGYLYTALYVVAAVGVAIAGGGSRITGPAVLLVVFAFVAVPPDFVSQWLFDQLGTSYRYFFIVARAGFFAMLLWIVREASRASTREVAVEPAAPLGLLGTSLRARVIAGLVLIGFTMIAMAGKNLGAMKLALVTAPIINVIAFVMFAQAAVRASRGLDRAIEGGFVVGGLCAAWSAGVTAAQAPSLYMLISSSADSYTREHHGKIAQAFPVLGPLIAAAAVVVALIAAGSYLRRNNHPEVAARVMPRATTFVILMAASTLLQHYMVPKVKSVGEYLGVALLAAVAGIIALLVAARGFKAASEAVHTTSLPPAKLLEG